MTCAYLIGADSGDSSGKNVSTQVLSEYIPHLRIWLSDQDHDTQAQFKSVDLQRDVASELVWNLYGRRPAGSNCRKKIEQVVTQDLTSKGYQFVRGTRDPTVYTCVNTRATLLRHVDGTCLGSFDSHLEFLQSNEGSDKYLDMKKTAIRPKWLNMGKFSTGRSPIWRFENAEDSRWALEAQLGGLGASAWSFVLGRRALEV